ncbi:MAG TPA: M3 family metallopeptidase [Woeseiaceae bacterium]|nr:M3 family metallopeptidase [Woeseiaceae bacterium]
MSNPLLDVQALPRFADIRPEHALPALTETIAGHRRRLDRLLDDRRARDFDSFVVPLEDMHHELARIWSPIGHLHSVLEDPGWRDAYNACLPLLTEHGTELAQNKALQQVFEQLAGALGPEAPEAQRTLIEKALRDFRLGGVALPEAEKTAFREAMQELAAVQAKFEQNLQDATDSWHLQTDDPELLRGLPEQTLERAKADALLHGESGWRLNLDYPTWQAVITHADDRRLRKRFYDAWSTRASDQGGFGQWDNSGNIERILALRHEIARLVGFANYAEYSLATKMAAKPGDVIDFLNELSERTRAAAERELAAVQELAPEPLEAWDLNYWLEQLKQQKFSIADEVLRQYFPVDKVTAGLFELAEKLYGVRLSRKEGVATWHDTVRYFEVRNESGEAIGGFYTDLYARNGKRGGAWIDECIVRKCLAGSKVPPVGYLVCNFSPPNEAGVSLLTHNDVVTLFHEFGHMLHHLLTRVDYPSLAGVNGVPWDAVELPSQFMENYAWSFDVLARASGHHATGEPLPRELFDRLEASRHFGAALAMLRQLEFALFDFRLHAEYAPEHGAAALRVLAEVRDDVALVRHPEYNRLPQSFSHIFAGGYAAGYYSYKWAEVLAADAFAAFEEAGIFDRETALRFRSEILEIGGSRDFMQAYVAFRGRKPTLDALLRQSGIGKAA